MNELEKRKTIVLYWTDEFSERFWNNGRFLLTKRFFRTNFKKRINERFHWTKVLLNERICFTNVQWENEQNRWNMNCKQLKKNRTNWVVQERCTNEMKKSRMRPSVLLNQGLGSSFHYNFQAIIRRWKIGAKQSMSVLSLTYFHTKYS